MASAHFLTDIIKEKEKKSGKKEFQKRMRMGGGEG